MVLESVSWAIAGPECLPHVVVVRSTHVHGVWESPGPAVSVPASQLLLLLWNCGGVRGGEAREVKMGREEREKKERELKGRAGRAGAGTGLGDRSPSGLVPIQALFRVTWELPIHHS